MDGATISPTVALIVAIGGFLGATLTPMAVAFINRPGKDPIEHDAVPWEQYAALTEQLGEVTENLAMVQQTVGMLERELTYVRGDRDSEHHARLAAEASLDALRKKSL